MDKPRYIIMLYKVDEVIMTSKVLTGTPEEIEQFAKITKVLFGADRYEITEVHHE